MSLRLHSALLVLLLCCTAFLPAKNKKKSVLPDYVLKARTVLVLIDPGAGLSASAPLANKTAQDDVEKALMNWGRLQPVTSAETADLIITVRKGNKHPVEPVISGIPTNDRPVIFQPHDGGIRIGGQQGRNPQSGQTGPQDAGPSPGAEVGPSEDVFAVYQGNSGDLASQMPIWRLMSKDALHPHDVPAVSAFRKAIEDSLKHQQQSKNSNP